MGKFESFVKQFSKQANNAINPEKPRVQERGISELFYQRAYAFLIVILIIIAVIPIIKFLSPGAQGRADISASVNEGADETLVIPGGVEDEENDQSLALTANAILAKEINSYESLYTYRDSSRWPIASLTKLMTATVALEELGKNTILGITQEAIDTEGIAGGFLVGERFTVSDLVVAMMTVSSNDAAAILAFAYDVQFEKQTTSPFVEKMRIFAEELGMSNTFFNDATGLSAVNQSTPKDIERLILYILANHPQILSYSNNHENTISDRQSGTPRELININKFSIRDDFLGGKTGFTDDSGENLVSIFKHNGKNFLIIIFGSKDRFEETLKIYDWIKDYE